jgi:hypothetical protein
MDSQMPLLKHLTMFHPYNLRSIEFQLDLCKYNLAYVDNHTYYYNVKVCAIIIK